MTTQRWTITQPQTIELDDVSELSARIVDGRLDVVAHDEPVTRIEVHSTDGRPVEVQVKDGKLVVGHEALVGWKPFFEKFSDFTGMASADIYIAVPRAVPCRVGTIRGETMLAGTRGDMRAKTISGSILVTDTEGSLDVNTISGEVTAREHTGNVRINGVSGDVTITGNLTSVESNTVSGTVTLDLFSQPGRLGCNAVSGDLLVRLPDPACVEAKLTSMTGRLVVGGVEATGFGSKTLHPTAPAQTVVDANAVSGNVTVIGRN